MATHSSVLAWRIPGTGKPDGLPSMGSHRLGHDSSDLTVATVYTYMTIGCVCVCVCVCVCAKSLQSCLTLWDPMDHSPLGSSVHGIL